MSRPFLLAQLSDPHIGADWVAAEPAARFEAAVEAVRALPSPPDAVLVTGDLAENGRDTEYEQARELLARLEVPVHVLPGNHDDRRALRRRFGLPGADAAPVHYAVDLGPLRLVVLDSTRPGEDPGTLGSEQLAWLDAELGAAPYQPTLLAMHHPPFLTGIRACDEVGLPASDRSGLAEVVGRHAQVRRLVAGHVHRAITGALAGRPAMTIPSTYAQLRLTFGADDMDLAEEPAAFAVHAVVDGEVVSHVQPVG